MDDPPAVLDGAEPAHQQVLLGCRGAAVRGVVDREDDDLRPSADDLALDAGKLFSKQIGVPDRRQPREPDGPDLAPPARGPRGSARSPRSGPRATSATARTRRTAPGAPCRSGRPRSRSRRTRGWRSAASAPSSRTAPTSVGRADRARSCPARTPASPSSRARAGVEGALSPDDEIGWRRRRASREGRSFIRATARSSSSEGRSCAVRRRPGSSPRRATAPFGSASTGSRPGARRARRRPRRGSRPARRRPLPHRSADRHEQASTTTTTKVDNPRRRPPTRAGASGRRPGWTPSCPHENPPSGQRARTPLDRGPQPRQAEHGQPRVARGARSRRERSRTRDATAADRSDERPPRHLAEPQDPVEESAEVRRAPNDGARAAAPRRGPASRTTHSRARRPTNASGHQPSGGNASERTTPRRGDGELESGAPRSARSGAVPAEHPLLVRELAPMLHQEASLADELGGLGRHHPGLDRLEALVLGEGRATASSSSASSSPSRPPA